jgi:hypothetical protein
MCSLLGMGRCGCGEDGNDGGEDVVVPMCENHITDIECGFHLGR